MLIFKPVFFNIKQVCAIQLKPPKVNKARGRYVWILLQSVKAKKEAECCNLILFSVRQETEASCCNPPPISIKELRTAVNKGDMELIVVLERTVSDI